MIHIEEVITEVEHEGPSAGGPAPIDREELEALIRALLREELERLVRREDGP